MKKSLFVLFLILFSFHCFAENMETEKSVKAYQLENSLIGLGIGSFIQGDPKSGVLLAAMDVTGAVMLAGGIVAYNISSVVIDGLRSYSGEVTTADLWVSGGVALTGLAVIVAGRILGWNIPTHFESRKNNLAMNVFVAPGYEGITAGFTLEL